MTNEQAQKKVELEGEGWDTVYHASWAGESGLLIDSASGWDYYEANTGVIAPLDFFSDAGKEILVEMGFTD